MEINEAKTSCRFHHRGGIHCSKPCMQRDTVVQTTVARTGPDANATHQLVRRQSRNDSSNCKSADARTNQAHRRALHVCARSQCTKGDQSAVCADKPTTCRCTDKATCPVQVYPFCRLHPLNLTPHQDAPALCIKAAMWSTFGRLNVYS